MYTLIVTIVLHRRNRPKSEVDRTCLFTGAYPKQTG